MLKDPKWDKKEQQVTEEPWRQVLRDAASELKRRGHVKRELCDNHGRVCVRGAIWAAVNGDVKSDSLSDAYLFGLPPPLFIEADNRLFAFLGENPAIWNNADERTKAEVVSALRAAAEA
jgi:hypothetical protein